jgi:hypothetical protein
LVNLGEDATKNVGIQRHQTHVFELGATQVPD